MKKHTKSMLALHIMICLFCMLSNFCWVLANDFVDPIIIPIANSNLMEQDLFCVPLPDLVIMKSSMTLSDPYNGTNNPKAIPGAVAIYTITVTNTGNGSTDANSLVINDEIPENTELYVKDINPPANPGPIRFTDGLPASGLTYTFIGLDNTSDDISFSDNEGITFNYIPIPDANGCDCNVTHIKIMPKGAMQGSDASAQTSFSVQMKVRIQ